MKSSANMRGEEELATLTSSMAADTNCLKKTRRCARNALVIVFLLQAGMAAAQNLVTNPGFETGNTTGWSVFGSPTILAQTGQVHAGSYACLVTNRTDTYMGIARSLQGVLQPDQTYNISAWLRLVNGANQTMQLTLQKTDGSGTSYSSIASGSVSASGWLQLSGQYAFHPSGTVTSLVFYAEVTTSTNAAYFIDDVSVVSTSVTPANGQCTVDWTNVFQRIDGFGASSAWIGSWTTNQANMFFGINNGTSTSFDGKTNFSFTGVGLSLLRNHITYASSTSSNATPGTSETSIMQYAQARGALIWSTPWTPAAGFKSVNDIYDTNKATGSGINGGSYRGSGNNITNLNYASQLANYVVSMKNQGLTNLFAISVQNEPDANVTSYEACQWTGAQIHDFVTNLNKALVAKGVGSTKIIIPESQNWSSDTALYTPTLNDANAAAVVSIIANHNYVPDNVTGDTTTPAALSVSGKSLWETEVSQIGGGFDGSMTNAVYWAGRIHLFLTQAQANAWHFWWLVPLVTSPDNEGLTNTNGVPAKRMYALGQFARFVRPGYYRIDIPTNTGSALVSAYKNTNSGSFAIVAINSSPVVVTQVFNFAHVTGISSVTPWMTTSSLSLASQTAVDVTNGSFSYVLPALSVATFIGQTNAGPAAIATTLDLASSANPSTYGNAVTFTATVRTNGVPVGGIAGETITFYNRTVPLGTGTLNASGQAAYNTSAAQLTAATHVIAAGYGGDLVYSGSTNTLALPQIVNPAALTAGLTGTVSKNYNGATAAVLAAGNYTLPGVVSGDTVMLNNPAGGTYDTRNAGSGKTVTVTGLAISGASATNYTLSSASVAGAVGTINKTNLTVTAAANSKNYDGTTGAAALPMITTGSLQTNDTANFSETYNNPNAGTGKTLTPSGSINDVNGGNNYNCAFVASNNGTINPATLTYTANAAGMTYGAAVPDLSGSVSGFVDGDTQSNATTGTLSFTTPATSSSGAGSYAVNGTGLAANNGNYSFVQAAGNVTALTINALTVNLTGSRPYDGTATAAAEILSVSNKVGNDDVNVASGSGTLVGANLGPQTIASLGNLALGGASAGNYMLTGAGGSVDITVAGLTVTNLLALDKVYDGATNATLNATNAGLAGIVNGEDVTLLCSNAVGYFADKNAGTNKPVTVNGLTLTGTAVTNYTLIQSTDLTANIIPAGLTLTGVTAANKVYDGTTNATLNGTTTLNGLLSGDSASLATNNPIASFADANVGTNKPVTVACVLTGTDAGNYTLVQPNGLTADILPLVTPVFEDQGISAGPDGWQLSFSAQPGQSYKVLASDDLLLPLNQWTVIGNGTFGSGTLIITDVETNLTHRFYLITSP